MGLAVRVIVDVVFTGRLLVTVKKPAVIAINNVLVSPVVPAIATAVNMSNPGGVKFAPGIIPAVPVTAIVIAVPAARVNALAVVGLAKRATVKTAVIVTVASAGPAVLADAFVVIGLLSCWASAAAKKAVALVTQAATGSPA